MRVLINAASAHMGGAVTYLHNLLEWLPRVAPEDHFTVYVPAATREKLASREIAPTVQLERYPFARTSGPARIYFDQVLLPYLVRKQGFDLLFSSTGFGTFFMAGPQVLLVRNLAYFDRAFQAKYKELGRSLRKNTLRRWHSLLSMRQAELVLFPTRAMQDMVEAYMALSEKSTAVLPYGFDHGAFAQQHHDGTELVQEVRRWKAEGNAILLSVSTYAVQKNFETLVEALPRLVEQGVPVKLLTTLSREVTTDKAEYDALKRRVQELGVQDRFVELGYVPYQQLGALYQEADVYVFPSFTESFGHSMVEAMAAGLPVVAADTPVNKEVCGAAGFYFRTFDPVDCAAQIAALLQDAGRGAEGIEASLARAKDFSWRRYTEQLVAIFHDMQSAS